MSYKETILHRFKQCLSIHGHTKVQLTAITHLNEILKILLYMVLHSVLSYLPPHSSLRGGVGIIVRLWSRAKSIICFALHVRQRSTRQSAFGAPHMFHMIHFTKVRQRTDTSRRALPRIHQPYRYQSLSAMPWN